MASDLIRELAEQSVNAFVREERRRDLSKRLNTAEKHQLRSHLLSGRLHAWSQGKGVATTVSLSEAQWSYLIGLMNKDMGLDTHDQRKPSDARPIKRSL